MKFKSHTLLSLILFSLLISALMGLEEFFEGELAGEGVVEEMGVYLVILFILLVLVGTPMYGLIRRLNTSMPWDNFFLRRMSIKGGIVLSLSAALGYLFGMFIHHFIEHQLEANAVWMRTFLFMLVMTSLIVGILELMMISKERERLAKLNEHLEKEKIITLYNALKNQVNPHFLFNSLSVLSSLIYFDVKKADKFISHFSQIYRYVLELKDENLVSLERELAFVKSYLFLQQIRLGDKLKATIDIPSEALSKMIPPLSLQIVVENAIKHNAISPNHPMHLSILFEENTVKITNSLRPLKQKKASTGVGLQNLIERYKLIHDTMPVFREESEAYVSELPLISSLS